jgi:hypothetical protein
MSEAIGSLLENRMSSIELKRVTTTNTNSIELGQAQKQTATINIPEAIDALIDNKNYRNKFRKLIREGHLNDLLELAKMAKDKDTPSHWFAKWTRTTPEKGQEGQPTHWERTLQFLARAREVAQAAAEVVKRIPVPTGRLKAVYKACWKLKGAVVRHAVTAEETGRDKFRYFCWLCYGSAGRQ